MDCILCACILNKMMKPYDNKLFTVLIESRNNNQTTFSIVSKRCARKNELTDEEMDSFNDLLKNITREFKSYDVIDDTNNFRGVETIHFQYKFVVSNS